MNVSGTPHFAVADESVTNQIALFTDDFCEMVANIMHISAYDLLYDRRLLKALDYIADNYKETIIQSELARYVGISPPYLANLLKEQCHMTFTEIVNEIQVAHSLAMICQTNDPIEQIAFDCGFGTGRTFTREFRQCTGFTPTDFRNIYRNLLHSGSTLPCFSSPGSNNEIVLFG